MAKEKQPPPPLIPLHEIEMPLVEEARRIKATRHVIPPSKEALELIRYMRTTGQFDGKGYRGAQPQEEDEPPAVNG